jgi:hypothetical protein
MKSQRNKQRTLTTDSLLQQSLLLGSQHAPVFFSERRNAAVANLRAQEERTVAESQRRSPVCDPNACVVWDLNLGISGIRKSGPGLREIGVRSV